MIESIYTVKALSHIRHDQKNEAIHVLEGMLDQQIIERIVTDSNFSNYIVGMPDPNETTTQKLEARIIQYRKSNKHECKTPKNACDLINGYIYGEK